MGFPPVVLSFNNTALHKRDERSMEPLSHRPRDRGFVLYGMCSALFTPLNLNPSDPRKASRG